MKSKKSPVKKSSAKNLPAKKTPASQKRLSKATPTSTPNQPTAKDEFEAITSELSAGENQDAPEPGVDPTLPTNLVRGAPGHQVPETRNEDEDGEGQSQTTQAVESGVRAARREQAVAAARAPKRTG